MIKKRLSIALLLAIAGLAVFGLLAMGHSISEHKIGGCFGIVSETAVCPEMASPFYFANFHINVFHSLLLTVLNASALFLAAWVLAALLKSDILGAFRLDNYALAFSRSKKEATSTISKILFRKWLALLEKRDAEACVFTGASFFPI